MTQSQAESLVTLSNDILRQQTHFTVLAKDDVPHKRCVMLPKYTFSEPASTLCYEHLLIDTNIQNSAVLCVWQLG